MQASRNGRSALCALRVLDQRVRADLLAQVLLVPGVPVDRADHAEGIARRRQEDRDRAGLHQRALVQRLVVVAVEQHEVAAPQHRVRDDLVRGAGAVQHEVGLVGAEHLRGVPLRLHRRAFVDQQIAEIDVGVAQVVAEDALAEVLEEQLPGRRLAIELAALVARAVEGDVGLAVVGHQPAEERRQQVLAVLDEAGDHLLGVEGGRLLAEIDVAVDLAGQLDDGEVGDAVRVRQRPERRVEADARGPRAPACAPARGARRRPARCRRRPRHPRRRRGRSCRSPRPRSSRRAMWSSSSLVCAVRRDRRSRPP